MRKHSVKNAGKFKIAPVNFGDAEEICDKNGDFACEKIKICHSVSDCKLEIAPKIRFRKVVLENQVCRGLKMSLKCI